MKNLNTLSILNCVTESQETQHQKEIEKVLTSLWKMDVPCNIRTKRVDVAGKNEIPYYEISDSQHIEAVLQSCDFKNGVDVARQGNVFVFTVWGQGYTLKDAYHLVQTEVRIELCMLYSKFKNLDLRNQIQELKDKWYYKSIKEHLVINKKSVVYDDDFKFVVSMREFNWHEYDLPKCGIEHTVRVDFYINDEFESTISTIFEDNNVNEIYMSEILDEICLYIANRI